MLLLAKCSTIRFKLNPKTTKIKSRPKKNHSNFFMCKNKEIKGLYAICLTKVKPDLSTGL